MCVITQSHKNCRIRHICPSGSSCSASAKLAPSGGCRYNFGSWPFLEEFIMTATPRIEVETNFTWAVLDLLGVRSGEAETLQ